MGRGKGNKTRWCMHNNQVSLWRDLHACYGLPTELVSDQGTHFLNYVITCLLNEFQVIHNKSVPYHPQENGQVESTNKTFCTIITKIITTKHERKYLSQIVKERDVIQKFPTNKWDNRLGFNIRDYYLSQLDGRLQLH